jgi:hypothetical protein
MGMRLLVVVAVALGLLLLGPASPSRATGCAKLDVRVGWANGDPDSGTPWPEDSCVLPTPFTTISEPEANYNDPSATHPMPRRVHVKTAVLWPLP